MKSSLLGAISGSSVLPSFSKSRTFADFPEHIEVDDQRLHLNGVGIREATLLKINVYAAALYLEQRSSSGEHIARSEELKQMRLSFLRDVSCEDMSKNIEAGFKASAGSDFEKLRTRLDQLVAWLPSLKTGDTLTLTYIPGTGLEFAHGPRRTTIVGADFARAMFLIWLGKNPPNPSLKVGLLGQAS